MSVPRISASASPAVAGILFAVPATEISEPGATRGRKLHRSKASEGATSMSLKACADVNFSAAAALLLGNAVRRPSEAMPNLGEILP